MTQDARVIALLDSQLSMITAMAKTLELIAQKLDKIDDVKDRLDDVKDSVIDAKVAIDDVKFSVDDVKSVVGNVEEAVDDAAAKIAKAVLHACVSGTSRSAYVTAESASAGMSADTGDHELGGYGDEPEHETHEDRCLATTSKGLRCRFPVTHGAEVCLLHLG